MSSEAIIEPPRLVPLHAVCRQLGVSERTAHRWFAAGCFPIPSVRVGHKIMFRPAEVARFVEGER